MVYFLISDIINLLNYPKQEALAFKDRWRRVNKAEIEELRRMSLIEKLEQVAALMASVNAFGWRDAMTADEQQVRDRWQRLRKAFHSEHPKD